MHATVSASRLARTCHKPICHNSFSELVTHSRAGWLMTYLIMPLEAALSFWAGAGATRVLATAYPFFLGF